MRALNQQPPGLRIPESLVADPAREEVLRDLVWDLIVAGVSHPVELADAIAGGDEGLSEEAATAIARFLLAARRAQQAGFGRVAPTNFDRAFAELEAARVVAKQNFACCGNCGVAEIDADINVADWAGYVFFHAQDTEGLVHSGETYLNYGVFLPHVASAAERRAMSPAALDELYERETLAVVREKVIPILESNGITVVWDGTMATRLLLSNAEFYAPV